MVKTREQELKELDTKAGHPEWTSRVDPPVFVSPDGATNRSIGDRHSPYYMFSSDGKLLYGMRAEQDRELLFSVDIATGAEKILGDVGREFRPNNNLNPTIRFSMVLKHQGHIPTSCLPHAASICC
jgi:hypothetical protein